MITLDETIRGIWYCPLIPDEQDFLLSLTSSSEGQYQITYRFRYYNSSDPFDEKDKKNWYTSTITSKNEAEVIAKIHNIFLLLTNTDDFAEILRGDRSLDEFIEEFMKQDFVHTKREKLH